MPTNYGGTFIAGFSTGLGVRRSIEETREIIQQRHWREDAKKRADIFRQKVAALSAQDDLDQEELEAERRGRLPDDPYDYEAEARKVHKLQQSRIGNFAKIYDLAQQEFLGAADNPIYQEQIKTVIGGLNQNLANFNEVASQAGDHYAKMAQIQETSKGRVEVAGIEQETEVIKQVGQTQRVGLRHKAKMREQQQRHDLDMILAGTRFAQSAQLVRMKGTGKDGQLSPEDKARNEAQEWAWDEAAARVDERFGQLDEESKQAMASEAGFDSFDDYRAAEWRRGAWALGSQRYGDQWAKWHPDQVQAGAQVGAAVDDIDMNAQTHKRITAEMEANSQRIAELEEARAYEESRAMEAGRGFGLGGAMAGVGAAGEANRRIIAYKKAIAELKKRQKSLAREGEATVSAAGEAALREVDAYLSNLKTK